MEEREVMGWRREREVEEGEERKGEKGRGGNEERGRGGEITDEW